MSTFGILLCMSTLEVTRMWVCPPTCDTVWDILQLCKLIWPFPRKKENSVLCRRRFDSPALGLRPLATFSSVWPEALQMLAVAFARVDWKVVSRPVASNMAFPVACFYLKKPRTEKRHCALGLWAQSHEVISCGTVPREGMSE